MNEIISLQYFRTKWKLPVCLIIFILCVAITCFAHPLTENMPKRSSDFAKFNGRGVTYTCKDGFSFNQDDSNDTTRTVRCQADGFLEQLSPPDCTRKHLLLSCWHHFFDFLFSLSAGAEIWIYTLQRTARCQSVVLGEESILRGG